MKPAATPQPNPFVAELLLIDINPYVFVPEPILETIFEHAGRRKGPIPVCGSVNGVPYRQTLVRFRGDWRLYISIEMLKRSPRRIGERIEVSVAFDAVERPPPVSVEFAQALAENPRPRRCTTLCRRIAGWRSCATSPT